MTFFEEELKKEYKKEFISIYRENIKREGSEELLKYLESCDFFDAPASARFHSNFEGGLCHHSINVYKRLKSLLDNEETLKGVYSDETIAIVGLLHDLCKTNFYVIDYKNVKENGVWVSRPFYKIDEVLPFGHGEKSVYLIQKYMKLSDDEALAINWHMGPYDDRAKADSIAFNQAFHSNPLIFMAHTADSMASILDESREANY